MTTMLIAVNEMGRRFGQRHHRAKLTDRDVELMLQLRGQGWSCAQIARKFEVSRGHAWRICCGLQRNHRAERWKRIEVKGC